MKPDTDQPKAPEPKPGSKPDAKDDAKDDLKSLSMPELQAKLGSPPDSPSQAEAQKRLTQYNQILFNQPTYGEGEPMISNILVPTDGSKTAQKAARYAIDLATQLKCSIIILSIVDNRSLVAQTIPARENARHIIEPVEDYLREAAEAYAGEIKKFAIKRVCDQRVW